MNHDTLTHAARTADGGPHRALYWTAFAVAVPAVVVAMLGQAFPGSPDVPGGVCDAPGAAGCNPGDTWTFMAVLLGGGLTALVLVAAVIAHVGHEMSASRRRRRNASAEPHPGRLDDGDEPRDMVPRPRRYSDLP